MFFGAKKKGGWKSRTLNLWRINIPLPKAYTFNPFRLLRYGGESTFPYPREGTLFFTSSVPKGGSRNRRCNLYEPKS